MDVPGHVSSELLNFRLQHCIWDPPRSYCMYCLMGRSVDRENICIHAGGGRMGEAAEARNLWEHLGVGAEVLGRMMKLSDGCEQGGR